MKFYALLYNITCRAPRFTYYYYYYYYYHSSYYYYARLASPAWYRLQGRSSLLVH